MAKELVKARAMTGTLLFEPRKGRVLINPARSFFAWNQSDRSSTVFPLGACAIFRVVGAAGASS